jgi:tellurite resistance protein
MDRKIKILEGFCDFEKGAYLGAIASIATADRSASEEELAYIEALCESANLSDQQSQLIAEAASSQMSDHDLERCLDVLKQSELRFSLVSDVIAFAQSDKNYSIEETKHVEEIAQYLGLNEQ